MSVLFLDRVSKSAGCPNMKKSDSLHEPTARDTHERDDNVIFAQFVDLGDASVCHLERGINLTSPSTQACSTF